MITLDLARRLRLAGLVWTPRPGDRFVVMTPGMEDDVFYLADMTVEVHRFVDGPVIGFNGTTEWALDSVELKDTLWLPREDQLREALGAAFVGLDRSDTGYAVHLTVGGSRVVQTDEDAELAYARALLVRLTAAEPLTP
ncbi:MAG: pilus assembly protein CpaE [Actinomycetota bacterium]|jgi:hypothetical protein|nr:pilus assembly protein CpaE [Actinomycetota bacterium]MDQ3527045.1 pilus assembly protein CpaE [Actinomycetota bacterium]